MHFRVSETENDGAGHQKTVFQFHKRLVYFSKESNTVYLHFNCELQTFMSK